MTPYGYTSNDTLVCIVGVIATLAWYMGANRGIHVGHKRATDERRQNRPAVEMLIDGEGNVTHVESTT